MSSQWPSALTSLDESLKDLDSNVLLLQAARPFDYEHMLGRLKQAAESSHQLRSLLISEMPQARWRDRSELDALLVIRAALRRRAYLLALANELEYGTISHRRAARVTQLNQLRDKAIDELRKLASADDPLSLPGPDAMRWIAWASSLKEPEDTAALQALRAGFPRLDEFVAALEPGMWVVPLAPAPEDQAQAAASAALAAQELEQRRGRLLGLATELERGDVVHHRAIRVTQVNELREQAIQELRFQAVVARAPAILPGPEAEQWVHWACTLKEPDDAAALQNLREGFVHLDEFVANLEPGMWISGAAVAAQAAAAEAHAERPQEQAARSQTAERETPHVAPVAAESPRKERAVTTLIATDDDSSHGFAVRLKSALSALPGGKMRIVLPMIVLLLAVLGAMVWRLHRTSASSPAKAAEAAAPENAMTTANAGTSNTDSAAVPANSAPRAPDVTDKNAKPKDANDNSKSAAAAAAQQKPEAPPPPQLTDTSLLTPQAMPKNAVVAKAEEPSNPADGSGTLPGTVPGGVPNSVTNFVKEVPSGAPKVPTQKLRVSSGVAQGQLIHQVTPVYPTNAKIAGVHGTVVLQAQVGKDGKVQNVHALRGPPMLVQSAVDAVKQWRYKPFAVNGEPAEADIEVNVNFNP